MVTQAEWSARCQRWLDEIDVQHVGEQELAEIMSCRTPSSRAESSHARTSSMSIGNAPSECNNDWRATVQSFSTPLCMGLVVTIPQWSYVQDSQQRKFSLFHLACRRGNMAWEVRKRYSDFVMLHAQLQHQYHLALFLRTRLKNRPRARNTPFVGNEGRFSAEPLPSLPKRRLWWSTNSDVTAVIRRALALQTYLQQLIRLPRPTQPFSPLNRFLSESNSSYVRVLSTSHIIAFEEDARSEGKGKGALEAKSSAPPDAVRSNAMSPSPSPGVFSDIQRNARDPSKALIRIEYPDWVQHEEFWARNYQTDVDKMQLVISISRKNVSFGSGGPFGAAIFCKSTNRLVSVGMSLVEHGNNCCLHAEMVAVQMATTLLRSHTLDRDPEMEHELFASSEPCAMCIGATLWCGVQRLVCAATDVDVRSLLHDTGPVFEESFRYLQSKGIQIKRKFLRSEAKQVLCEFSAARTSVAGRQV